MKNQDNLIPKWEYIVIGVGNYEFNELGKVGWELVAIDQGEAYFKRPLIDLNEKSLYHKCDWDLYYVSLEPNSTGHGDQWGGLICACGTILTPDDIMSLIEKYL